MTPTSAMASMISTTSRVLCSLSSTSSKLAICAVSSCIALLPKVFHFHLSSWFSPLGQGFFSPWNGLKHLGISSRPKPLHIDRKGWCKGTVVYACLFGVGAPEDLVIGVMALLVFGPKGLAERVIQMKVARNLGKTLHAFQPTIRELQEVSSEFKTTLEREIGLDDISGPTQNTCNSNAPNTTSAPSSISSTNNSQIAIDPSE